MKLKGITKALREYAELKDSVYFTDSIALMVDFSKNEIYVDRMDGCGPESDGRESAERIDIYLAYHGKKVNAANVRWAVKMKLR